jgi:outer membrane protein
MRRPSVPALCALACLLSILPSAQAQQAQDRARASALQPAAAPAPSMQDIAAAFEPVSGGLTSEESVKLAIEHSPELRKADLALDTAAANRARASIAFAPRFDFTGKYTQLSRFKLEPLPGTAFKFPQIFDQWYTQANATLPITDVFLTVIPQYKAASKSLEVASLRRAASELQVSYHARVAFYSYAHVIGEVIVARKSVALLEANVSDLESLVQAGTATETDLVRARAELGKARARAVESEGMQELALARLSAIVGTALDAGRPIGEPFVNIELAPTPTVAIVDAEAKRSRPEILGLRKLEEVREYLAKSRRGAQAPKLSGFGNFYYANPNFRQIPAANEWRHSWDVGLMLTWSPNDTVFAHTQYQDAMTELTSVREDLRLLQDGVLVEATQAVVSHRTAVASIDATTQSLEAARRYQADQRALMLAGAATPNDVLEAQDLFTRAAREWVDAHINARIAEAALLKAQGRTGLQSSTVSRSSTP